MDDDGVSNTVWIGCVNLVAAHDDVTAEATEDDIPNTGSTEQETDTRPQQTKENVQEWTLERIIR